MIVEGLNKWKKKEKKRRKITLTNYFNKDKANPLAKQKKSGTRNLSP